MKRFERILCPMDFSEFSSRAYDYAYSLAKHYGAELILQAVIQPLTATYPYYYIPEQITTSFADLGVQAENRLKEVSARYPGNSVRHESVVDQGLVSDCILTLADKREVDLIVMGTHGRHGLDHVVLGSVTEKIIRRTKHPVLAVRKPAHDFVDPASVEDPVSLQRILACNDFSTSAEPAVAAAVSLAMEYQARLTVFHVVETSGSVEHLKAEGEAARSRLIHSIPAPVGDWCNVSTLVRAGKPYQEINNLAREQQMDLVVMGVRGHNAVDLAVFGSTTHRVLQTGSCPVLTVRA